MCTPEEVCCKAEGYACAWPIHENLQHTPMTSCPPSLNTHVILTATYGTVMLLVVNDQPGNLTSSGASLHTIARAAQAATSVVQMEVR